MRGHRIFRDFAVNVVKFNRGKSSQRFCSVAVKCAVPFVVDSMATVVPAIPKLAIGFGAFSVDELEAGDEDEEPRIRWLSV